MKKILIVNDDSIISSLYQKQLELDGFEVQTVGDGEKAIDSLKCERPDLVILELMLPKVSGLGVLRFLRSQLETHFTPVIVLSNSYLRGLVEEAVSAGADRCVAKSECSSKQVVEMVRELLAPLQAAAIPPTAPEALPDSTRSAPGAVSAPKGKVAGFDVDFQFQREVQDHFLELSPKMLGALRQGLQDLANHPAAARDTLAQFYSTAHLLCGHAGLAGFSQLSQMASGLEALAKVLHDNPEFFTPSTLRTLAQSWELLRRRIEQVKTALVRPPPPTMILMLDDSPVDLLLIGDALEKVNLKGLGVGLPAIALKLLEFNPFDLVFLDVEMPEMNGFDLCAKLRTLPAHQSTPVVFVTVHRDVETIARSTISGGNDFIAKPFLDIELGVKALIHIQRRRFGVSAGDLENALSFLQPAGA